MKKVLEFLERRAKKREFFDSVRRRKDLDHPYSNNPTVILITDENLREMLVEVEIMPFIDQNAVHVTAFKNGKIILS